MPGDRVPLSDALHGMDGGWSSMRIVTMLISVVVLGMWVIFCFVEGRFIPLGWETVTLLVGGNRELHAHAARVLLYLLFLRQAEFERDANKAQAEIFWGEIEAQTDAAAACLAREAQTARDAAERKDIVEKAKPRPRTKKEQDEVVDDETRGRAVERLNRPL